LLLLLLPPAIYVGSYVALVEEPRYGEACYRYESLTLIRFFRPLEMIDRKVRPDRWVDIET
jgi:hypothetical protein